MALQTWLLPKSRSPGSFAALALLAAVAALWGTVLVARLFSRAAEAIEAAPGLPPATVVSAGQT
jgi:hypothetical protein